MEQELVDFLKDLNTKDASVKFEFKYSKEKNSVLDTLIFIQSQELPPTYQILQKADRSSKLFAFEIRTCLRTEKEHSLYN